MTTYVWRDGKMIDKAEAEPLHPTGEATYFIRDTIDALWHPATGQMVDSKSKFRQITRAAGCQEVGDQKDYGKQRLFTPKLDKRQRIEDIKRTVYNLRNNPRYG